MSLEFNLEATLFYLELFNFIKNVFFSNKYTFILMTAKEPNLNAKSVSEHWESI